MKTKLLFILSIFSILSLMGLNIFQEKRPNAPQKFDIHACFPKSKNDIIALTSQAIKEAQISLTNLISIPNEQRNFNNTIQAYDALKSKFLNTTRILGIIPMVYPDPHVCEVAEEQSLILQKIELEFFGLNQDLCNAISWYAHHKAPHENLNQDQKYILELIKNSFKASGLSLPLEQQKKVVDLKQKIKNLEIEFQKNVSKANEKKLLVKRDELAGVSEPFIQQLQQTSEGLYSLNCNYSTYMKIMTTCSVATTREKMYKFFINRAYPDNAPILKELLICKNNLAQLLGYASAAHLELQDTMAQTPEMAETFLRQLSDKVQHYETNEFTQLKNNLSNGITLSADKTLYPWDRAFIAENLKKNQFNLNQDLIKEYFPLETTLKNILTIYEDFLNVRLSCQPLSGLWNPDLYLVTLYQNETVIGHLILDLLYRPNKYHNACHVSIITPQYHNGKLNPGISVVLANFERDNDGVICLTHDDVATTLFHELGHALHALLGAAPFATLSGTNVKRDFVEVPSQMFEEWAWDAGILKKVSAHYKTGQPLPDTLIQKLQTTRSFHAATQAQTQIFYSLMALLFFKDGAHKDLHALFKELYTTVKPHDFYYPDNYSYCAFSHFISYDAKYYSYVWSKVIALDLFETINHSGLTNCTVGNQFKTLVLAPGGSKDPHELVTNFLGRPFNDTAYLNMLQA